MSRSHFAALCASGCAAFAAACSDDTRRPWTAGELNALTEQFSHIAEAYAVVDVCIPLVAADADAKHRVISKIGVRHYSQLSELDTEAELAKFIAHHRENAGSTEQVAALDRSYRDAHAAAASQLRATRSCEETIADYVNTILNTRVEPAG